MRDERHKFIPVTVNPQPCTAELAQTHLRAFADSFVLPAHRERWLHVTLEKPKKASRQMVKFHQYRDPARCVQIEGPEIFPLQLAARYGTERGVYFDGLGPPVMLTAAEAGMFTRDAVLSLIPGRLALFFFHEGWAWRCTR